MIRLRTIARGRSKFGNRWTEYRGHKYQSDREASYALMLDLRLRAKEILSWRRQIRFPLRVNGQLIAHYVIDFQIVYPDGSHEFVEIKGHWTRDATLKWKLWRALYPQLNARVEK